MTDYIARSQERDEKGRAHVFRSGKACPRKVTLGSGTVEARAPRVDDRRESDDGSRRRFHSQILAPYMCRSPKVAEVLPILYRRGLSTGDFKEGLAALLGEDASGLSPTAITRLTAAWQADCETFQEHDLSDRDYVAKYPKAVTPLRRDEAELLAFFDFPAEHWMHLRTANVIESPFATVRLLMAFKLLLMAQERWQRINAAHLIPLVRAGVVFTDGAQSERRSAA